MHMFNVFLIILCVSTCVHATKKRPNIVLILADDQDILLGGMKPLFKAKKLLAQQGTTFNNAYVTTPICCPSRSSILTGMYLHNHKTFNNSINGGCSSANWQSNYEHETFATYLKDAGYNTMFAGKYLNTYGHIKAKGVSHVPPGWDWWVGLVGNSKYYNYTLSVNGTAVNHGDNYKKDYLTDVIKRYAVEFIKHQRHLAEPFLMVLSTPAPHAPFTPAPQYKGYFSRYSVPRLPSFNIKNKNKHWLLRMLPSHLSDQTLILLNEIYRSRLETLLSVDDLVYEVIFQLKSNKLLDNTYIIYTSDNGFHIGEFALPWDKRQPYEFDLKIPMLLKGPGIPKNKAVSLPVLNIDLAPTILTLANIQAPTKMDGKSFVKNIKRTDASTVVKLKNQHERTFLIEYRGEGDMHSNSIECPSNADNTLAECSFEAECKCQDATNNTYNCIRHFSRHCNIQYCEFIDSEKFKEFYDLNRDPYQLHNTFETSLNDYQQGQYHLYLKYLEKCRGTSCSMHARSPSLCNHRYSYVTTDM